MKRLSHCIYYYFQMAFSLSSSNPLFPSLLPRAVDPLWHRVDEPKDEDAELTRLEKEHENAIKNISEKVYQPPIGKTSQDTLEEGEMDEDDDDNDNDDNDDSDSHEDDDDVEMDMNFGQESPAIPS